MKQYCIYLRKSRADAEAEAHGEGETLARHEHTLLELAKQRNLNVTQIYREIVSGETIAARPVMQQLLLDIEKRTWAGVLVMEVERLARGDTIDQGIVTQTFKYSETVIVTPIKTYDPNNEFDEEYFEFGLFMSRQEYKTINRRLQRGRIASVQEGKFIGSHPPYGYQKKKIEHDKGFTLQPDTEQAKVVKMIFDWYTIGETEEGGFLRRIGSTRIAQKLNRMNIKSQQGRDWTATSIRQILHNPVYAGKIRWHWRPQQKIISGSHVIKKQKYLPYKDAEISDGLQEAIIPPELFQKAQEYLSQHAPVPIGQNKVLQNPLAGILICGQCGHHLIRHKDRKNDMLLCPKPDCPNVSSVLSYVEERLLEALEKWLSQYTIHIKSGLLDSSANTLQGSKSAIKKMNTDLAALNKQLNTAYDLLEQKVYSTDTFAKRSGLLHQKIADIKDKKSLLQQESELEAERSKRKYNSIPKGETIINIYYRLNSVTEKNVMLKEILEKALYKKAHGSRWSSRLDDFELILFPRLPHES